MTSKVAKAEYLRMIEALVEILFRYDPAGINSEFNPDEYRPEAETIVTKLGSCASENDVRDAVECELLDWFDETTASAPEVPALAAEIWRLWQSLKYLTTTSD